MLRTSLQKLFLGQRFLGILALAIPAFILWIFMGMIGGPLLTPDSREYLRFASDPWNHLGSWPASGISYFLFLGRSVFLSDALVLSLIGGFRVFIVFLILKNEFRPRISFLLSLVVFFSPQWFQLNLTLWSETIFSVFLCFIGWALTKKSRNFALFLVLIFTPLFLFLTEIRNAGIFFLPGLAVALAISNYQNLFFLKKDFWQKFFVSFLILFFMWMGANLLRTGSATQPTKGNATCVYGFIALNELPFCGFDSSLEICALDPDRKLLNRTIDLNVLHFDPNSPYVRFLNQTGPDKFCEQYKRVLKAVFKENPSLYFNLLVRRFWNQFSKWDRVERGLPDRELTESSASFLNQLDDWVQKTWIHQSVYRILLVLNLLLLIVPGSITRAAMFFLLGGIGHALGIALQNPFLALRYQAIHKFCILMAFLLLLGGALRQIRRPSKPS